MYFRTQAQICLDALEHNVNQVRAKLAAGEKLLGVIKADAYGHGAIEIGKALEDSCDFFGVACIEEALELINAGIHTPILTLGYVSPEEFGTVVKNNIRIPIFSLNDAKALSEEAIRQGKDIPFHFCVDTGMSRIGFQATEESAAVCQTIAALPHLIAEGIFSHLARADEKDLSKAQAQIDLFKQFIALLENRQMQIPIKHIHNSAGIMNFTERFDMSRMGIVAYGLYPSGEAEKTLPDLQPVMRWITHISHIKTLPAGREISYGGTYTTPKEMRIATIPVGYADGYPRCLSNKGAVLIGGQYAPICGRVCMDQFMVDVSDIPAAAVGDEVVLIGAQGDAVLSMETVSEAAHSFNYELPCRISRRVARTYFRKGTCCFVKKYL